MGVRKYFSRVGKVDILVVHFRLLTIQIQIDVHITLYPCYTTKKMTHVRYCNSPKNELRWQQCFFSHRIKLGSNISFQFSHRMFHTVIYCYQQSLPRCITCHRCLRSTVTCSKTPTAVN